MRPLSAYIFFSNEMVPKVKAEEGISHREAMSRAGELWGKLSDADKKKYDEMNAADKKR